MTVKAMSRSRFVSMCLVGRMAGRRERQHEGLSEVGVCEGEDRDKGGGQGSVPECGFGAESTLREHESCSADVFGTGGAGIEVEEDGSSWAGIFDAAGMGLTMGKVEFGFGIGSGGDEIEDFICHSIDLAVQSIKGFSLSRKGIPRIMDCMPMGATKKVSCKETPEIEY
jgi:hypothetical protein